MIDNTIIFILADGHHNSLGLVRSLGKAGYKLKVYLIGSNGGIVKHSKYCKNLSICDNVNEAIDTIIAEYSDCCKIKFIVTGNDKFINVVDSRYQELNGKFLTYNCGTAGKLSLLMSKVYQNKLAEKVGLKVPPFAVVDVKTKTIPNIPFPVITKAINSIGTHWKDIVYLCHSKEELLNAYEKIDCDQIIVQHYVKKENETGFNGISINGGKDIYMPLQLTYKSSGETTFGNYIYLFRPNDSKLVKKIKKFIESSGISGSFSIDLLIGQDSEIYFLEINPRNSGWSYPYTCAGINLPAIWVQSTIKGVIDTSSVCVSTLPFSVVDEFLEIFDASKKGIKSTLKALYSIFRANALIYWDLYDMSPFWHIVKNTLQSRIKRVFNKLNL